MKFLCDVDRCIDCSGCVIACREGNHVPDGVSRRRVVTVNRGKPGEKSVSVSCLHCDDAPCIAVCPTGALYQREDGIVLVHKKICIGCGYCFMACPIGAPQFPKSDVFGARGAMDKCTFCAGEPKDDFRQNRLDEGKVPLCAGMCATKALLAGDAEAIDEAFRERAFKRGSGANGWGWDEVGKK